MDILTTIPENPEIEETEVPRDYVRLPDNLAENVKLTKQFHTQAYDFLQRFEHQDKRDSDYGLVTKLQESDAMYRMSKRRDRTETGDTQRTEDTLSNVPSGTFHQDIRTIVAGQQSMLFSGDDEVMPAKYTPIEGSPEYVEEEGKRLAAGYNLLWRYGYEQDRMEEKIKKVLHYTAKDSQTLLGLDWDYRTEKKVKRVPGYYTKDGNPVEYDAANPPKAGEIYDKNGKPLQGMELEVDEAGEPTGRVLLINSEDGMPRSYAFVEKEVIVANWPTLTRYCLKNAFYDMDIADPQKWLCFISRDQYPLQWFIDRQRSGQFVNAEKITEKQLYRGDGSVTDTEIEDDRADNTGEEYSSEMNGLFDVWHVWLRAPIEDDSYRPRGKSSKTKGVWNKNAIPVWYEAIFSGQLGGSIDSDSPDVLCHMLRRNPYSHGRLPRQIVFELEDDNGCLPLALSDLAAAYYEQDTKVRNQYYDNVDMVVTPPFIGEMGNLLERDMQFRQRNQVFWVRSGTSKTAVSQLDIKDVTQTAIPLLNDLRDERRRTMGTDNPLAGEYAGARTTGTEVLEVKNEAMKPAIEQGRFIADQIFLWLLPDYKELWDQFGDPDNPIPVKIGEVTRLVKPGSLYGELGVNVEAVDRFEQTLSARQAMVNFLNTKGAEMALQLMGENQVEFFVDMMRDMGMKEASKYFPQGNNFTEAEDRALQDVARIINAPETAMESPPLPEENHKVHLRVLENYKNQYVNMVRKDEQNPLTLEMFDAFINMHTQMDAQGQQGGTPGATPNQSPQPPAQAGEAAGDVLAGLQGQLT